MSLDQPGQIVGLPEPELFAAPNWDPAAQLVRYPRAFIAGERYATVSGKLTPPYPKSPTQPWTERKVAAWDRRCADWLVDSVNACPRPDLLGPGNLDPRNLSKADGDDAELRLFDTIDGNRSA